MVVVTLAGAILAFGIPAFRTFRIDSALPGARASVISEMKLTRQLAIAHSHDYAMKLDTANNRFQVYDPLAGLGTKWKDLGTDVSMASVTSPQVGGVFTFDYNGRIATNGSVILLSAKGTRDTINVYTSGKVTEQ